MEFENYDEDWVEEEDEAAGKEPGKLAGEEVTDSAAVLEIGESHDKAGEEEDAKEENSPASITIEPSLVGQP